jgi:hypothetical protein
MTDERPTPISRAALTEDAGRTCPYCRFALKQGATIIECGACHAPHHDDCWQDNAGCAVMGCKGGPGAGPTRAPLPDAPAQPAAPTPTRRVSRPAPPQPPAPVYQRPAVPAPPAPVNVSGQRQPSPPSATPFATRLRATPALTAALLVLALAIAGGAAALVIANKRSAVPPNDPVAAPAPATVTEQPSPPPAPPPPPPPAADPLAGVDDATMADDIARILLAHHRAIVNGSYRTAWLLTSTRYRAKKVRELGSFERWAQGQSDLADHLDPSGVRVAIQDVDRRSGVATVNVTGMGWSEPGSPCSTWSGVTWAKFERGHWRYEPGYSISGPRRRTWQPRQSELMGIGC